MSEASSEEPTNNKLLTSIIIMKSTYPVKHSTNGNGKHQEEHSQAIITASKSKGRRFPGRNIPVPEGDTTDGGSSTESLIAKRCEGEPINTSVFELDAVEDAGERKLAPTERRDRRDGQDRRVFLEGYGGVVRQVAEYLSKYIALPETSILVASAWVAASHLADRWAKFPHLAITSPEKRCGKTTLLELLGYLCFHSISTANISPACMYRLIEQEHPTLLLDEAQSLTRLGSESAEVLRELLNASIEKNAKCYRSGSKGEVHGFCIYGPKIVALIGTLDATLADRCLPIRIRRKTKEDQVALIKSKVVAKDGEEIKKALMSWAAENAEEIDKVYETLEPFEINNYRMADLLLPLQVVLKTASPGKAESDLRKYADEIDGMDSEVEKMSNGTRLLIAVKEIFETITVNGASYIPTVRLVEELVKRTEEPWPRYCRGEPITPEALANLLRPYGIRSAKSKDQKSRGFYAVAFEKTWEEFLPPSPLPETPSNPSISSEVPNPS
jgi:hypothetical protein